MRITLIAPVLFDFPANGIANVCQQTVRQLSAKPASSEQLELDVWSYHDRPRGSAELARLLGESELLRSGRLHWRGFKGNKLAMFAAGALALRAPDAVVTMHLGLAPVGRMLARRKTTMLQFLHGIECWRSLSARDRWALQPVDFFISNSAMTHERFLDANPEYGAHAWSPCWLGLSENFDVRGFENGDSSGSSEGGPSALIVGRMLISERYKGHRELIEQWRAVRRHVPGARLDIVGDGDDRSALEAQADELGLLDTGAVQFWGHLEGNQLLKLFRSCDVFAMPSPNEGFGLTYLEAMAFGKPVIASTRGGGSEIIDHEKTGLLVEPADPNALRDALCRLLGNPTLRKSLGERAHKRTSEEFSEVAFGIRLRRALAEAGVLV